MWFNAVYEAYANSSASGLPQQGVAVVVGSYFLVDNFPLPLMFEFFYSEVLANFCNKL